MLLDTVKPRQVATEAQAEAHSVESIVMPPSKPFTSKAPGNVKSCETCSKKKSSNIKSLLLMLTRDQRNEW